MNNDRRRAEFIVAASELYGEKGIANTSIGDIAARVGVARSLFYHYFRDKQDITDAVTKQRIDDFMAYVHKWTSTLGGEDVYGAIVGFAGVARGYLLGKTSLGQRLMLEHNEYLYRRFVRQTSALLADYFVASRNERGALIRLSRVRHPRESFYALSVGLMSLMIQQPDIPDETIADLIVDALHVDVNQKPV